jgi:hypothetical protein
MQHSHILRAAACAACLLMGGTAFAQGVGGAHATGGMGTPGPMGARAFHAGRMNAYAGNHAAGTIAGAHGFNSARNWHGRSGRGWYGYGGGQGGWGPGYAYGYPYDYGYDSDDSGYAYDGYDNGYAYDNGYGPDVYAQGEPGAYCQTPEMSCALDHPSVAGAPCQCRSGFDQEPGSAQP